MDKEKVENKVEETKKEENKKEDKKEDKKEEFKFNFDAKNEFDFGGNEFNFEPSKKKEKENEEDELAESLNKLHLKELNEEQLKKVEELKNIQKEITNLNEKFDQEFILLELKYEKLREPHILDRKKIVNSKTEDGKFTGIPSFWLNVLKNSELSNELIRPHDHDSLTYLEDVTFVLNEEPKGFTVEFHYTENPYFTNKVLKKQFIEVEGELSECKGTKIEWKDQDKDLTKKVVYKKKKHKGGGKPKKVKTFEDQESFYQFFKEYEEEVEEGSEEAYIRETIINSDIDLGQTLRESIIPNAIDYYLGNVEIEQGMYGDNEFNDEEGEEDDE